MRSPLQIIGLLLPTALILGWANRAVESSPAYREIYGSDDVFLDVYFPTNPKGYFQRVSPSASLKIYGFLVTESGTEKLSGLYRPASGTYEFATSAGEYRAVRGRNGDCTRALTLSSPKKQWGWLRSGQCGE